MPMVEHRAEGHHIFGKCFTTGDDRKPTDADKLVNHRPTTDEGVVTHYDVPGQVRGIGKRYVFPQDAIVSDV